MAESLSVGGFHVVWGFSPDLKTVLDAVTVFFTSQFDCREVESHFELDFVVSFALFVSFWNGVSQVELTLASKKKLTLW